MLNKPFNLDAILTRYEYNRLKALGAAKQQLIESNYNRKEISIILAIVDAFFDAQEEEAEKGAVAKRRSSFETVSYSMMLRKHF